MCYIGALRRRRKSARRGREFEESTIFAAFFSVERVERTFAGGFCGCVCVCFANTQPSLLFTSLLLLVFFSLLAFFSRGRAIIMQSTFDSCTDCLCRRKHKTIENGLYSRGFVRNEKINKVCHYRWALSKDGKVLTNNKLHYRINNDLCLIKKTKKKIMESGYNRSSKGPL